MNKKNSLPMDGGGQAAEAGRWGWEPGYVARPLLRMKQLVFKTTAILLALSLLVPCVSQAYVLPAEQIIQFMAANFAKFGTLVIRQSTTRMQAGEIPEREHEEVLSVKSPNLFHSSLLDSSAEQASAADRVFRELLIASTEERKLLAWLKDHPAKRAPAPMERLHAFEKKGRLTLEQRTTKKRGGPLSSVS